MYKGSAEQNVYEAQELPEHLKKMYEDNILELLIEEKKQFKNLLNEFSDILGQVWCLIVLILDLCPRFTFFLGCMSGLEQKINSNCKKKIPLQFQNSYH